MVLFWKPGIVGFQRNDGDFCGTRGVFFCGTMEPSATDLTMQLAQLIIERRCLRIAGNCVYTPIFNADLQYVYAYRVLCHLKDFCTQYLDMTPTQALYSEIKDLFPVIRWNLYWVAYDDGIYNEQTKVFQTFSEFQSNHEWVAAHWVDKKYQDN